MDLELGIAHLPIPARILSVSTVPDIRVIIVTGELMSVLHSLIHPIVMS